MTRILSFVDSSPLDYKQCFETYLACKTMEMRRVLFGDKCIGNILLQVPEDRTRSAGSPETRNNS